MSCAHCIDGEAVAFLFPWRLCRRCARFLRDMGRLPLAYEGGPRYKRIEWSIATGRVKPKPRLDQLDSTRQS